MKKILLPILLLIGLCAQAQEKQLSKEEFLALMDSGKIKFSVDPWLEFPNQYRDELNRRLKQKNANFDPAYMFVHSLKTNKFMYTVWYEWPTRKCIFRAEEINSEGKTTKIDVTGQDVDIKYCEMTYKMKIK